MALSEDQAASEPYRLVAMPDGSRWPPHRGHADDVEWRLRHAPEALTIGDRMVAAGILAAYRHLIDSTADKRRMVVAALRKETP